MAAVSIRLRFVAGYAFTGSGNGLTGTSIGNVSIAGEFLGSDLIASINAVDGTYLRQQQRHLRGQWHHRRNYHW